LYTPLKWLGKGAYGVVCSATHARTGERVAVKKVANAFDNATDARRTLREVRLLRHLRHDNVVALLDVLVPSTGAHVRDVYLVYELMDTDLHQIIRSPQPLTDEHCQYFVYQVRWSSGFALSVVAALFGLTQPFDRHAPPDPQGPEVHTQRQHSAPRPETKQPVAQRQLRPEDLRLWPCAIWVRGRP
jgi:hypothetical protein